ncbi:hypothetical protein [Achromobacter spanius]|uniref:Uncharacterized protein n=3 Tax=Alcaligenaceae TaxID=506 RepID=A0AAW3HVY6_9BURK|nr:hypothetical protein AFM18_26570 [Achromobacter spanius]
MGSLLMNQIFVLALEPIVREAVAFATQGGRQKNAACKQAAKVQQGEGVIVARRGAGGLPTRRRADQLL